MGIYNYLTNILLLVITNIYYEGVNYYKYLFTDTFRNTYYINIFYQTISILKVWPWRFLQLERMVS